MSKRKNPRNIPVSLADLRRAKESAVEEAVKKAMAIMFSVLCDKEHADQEIMRRVWSEVCDLSSSVEQGYVSVSDLENVLRKEYGIWF